MAFAFVKLCRQGLILALTLCVVSKSMGAEISKRCQEAASLWIPQENASAPITKWDSAIGYKIDTKQPAVQLALQIELADRLVGKRLRVLVLLRAGRTRPKQGSNCCRTGNAHSNA
ncbi:MAG: hypothetical protein WBE48_25260 [Xanthobacteraceae bacterium]|jgi:hypothetical protein